MNKYHEAEGAHGVQRAQSDQRTQKTQRYVASKELPTSIHVYLTATGTGSFILHTDTLWMGGWSLGSGEVTMPFLYRQARQQLRKPITFHLPTLDLVLDLVDELPNEIHYGRLALVWDEAIPPAPLNPDQSSLDLIAEIEALCEELDG